MRGLRAAWTWSMRVVEDWIPAALLAAATSIVVADVFGRYVLNSPVRGASEVATVLFIWAAMLGAAGVARRHQHVGVTIVPQLLRGRLRSLVLLLADLLVVVVSLLVCNAGVEYFIGARFGTIPVLGVPTRYVAAIVPVAFALIAIHYGARVPSRVLGLRDGGDLPVTAAGSVQMGATPAVRVTPGAESAAGDVR